MRRRRLLILSVFVLCATAALAGEFGMPGERVIRSGQHRINKLVLDQAALVQSLVPGMIEFAGHTFYGTQYLVRRSFGMHHGIITASTTLANSVTETTIFTGTQAPTYLTVGKTIHIDIQGFFSTVASGPTNILTLKLKLGNTTLLTTTTTQAVVTNGPLLQDWYFTVRTAGTAGTCISSAQVTQNNTLINTVATATTAIDTTASNIITVTAQWGNADPGNTYTQTMGWVETIG